MLTDASILIIEDDPLLAEQISQTLIRKGYKVAGRATNLEMALKVMKKEKPDLALIDIKLDGPEDGIATAKELLKIKWMPIIYITGDSIMEVVERSKSTFPAAFLEKPLRPKELLVQIDLALHNFNEGNLPSGATAGSDELFVLSNKSYIRIKPTEILYIEADHIYSRLFLTREGFDRLYPKTAFRPVHISMGLGNVLRQLPTHFYRLSRSLVINPERIDRLDSNYLFMGDHKIDIPESSRSALLARLKIRGSDR